MKTSRTGGDLRRRLLRHHLPLALASVVALVLFMSLPRFDANRYPHADLSSGALPQPRGEGRRMDEGGRKSGQHAAGEAGRHAGNQTGRHSRSRTGHHGGGQSRRQGGGKIPRSDETPSDSFLGLDIRRFTVATAYVATALLALTLLIGPANLLLRRRNPVSSYLRRDAGMWTAIFSVVHVIYGLQVHRKLSDFLNYFVARDGRPLTNSFGLGNWTGLGALVLAAGLLVLSSNAALRKLKARNWKRLQRLNYALFALVVAHAFFYGVLVRTSSPYTLLLLLSVIAVLVGQAVGVQLYRRRNSRRTARSA